MEILYNILNIVLPQITEAAPYVPLIGEAPELGIVTGAGSTNLANFLTKMFAVLISITGVLGVLMLVIGGIQYMTTDAVFKKSLGKQRILSATGGIILALSSWIILNTINPDLLTNEIDLGIEVDTQQDPGNIGLTGFQLTEGPERVSTGDGITTGLVTDRQPLKIVGNLQNQQLTPVPEGLSITPNRVAIDTDGINPPPFEDPHYQSQTSLAGLDANTDDYIVVPIGSPIPLNTPVTVYNHNTNTTIRAIVGDRGLVSNGYGELSLHAAQTLGAWVEGVDANSAQPHTITYIFHTKE